MAYHSDNGDDRRDILILSYQLCPSFDDGVDEITYSCDRWNQQKELYQGGTKVHVLCQD